MTRTRLVTALVAVLLVLPVSASAQDAGQVLARLLDAAAPSIVHVRTTFVLDLGGMMGGGPPPGFEGEEGGGGFEGPPEGEEPTLEQDGVGLVVDASGIVAVPRDVVNADGLLGGFPMGMPGMDGPQADLEGIEIRLPDGKTLNARIVHTDKKLGVTFLMAPGLAKRSLPALALDKTAQPDVGAEVYAIDRLDRAYGHAPFFTAGRLAGLVKNPATAWVASQLGRAGRPVFTRDGRLVGITGHLATPSSESGGGSPFAMMFGGARTAKRMFVLPAPRLRAAVDAVRAKLAKKTAPKK